MAFLGHMNEPVRLERSQVIVDLLTRNPETSSERRRRGRFRQFRKYPTSDGIKGYRRSRRITNDFYFDHESNLSLTTFIVKTAFIVKTTFFVKVDGIRRPVIARMTAKVRWAVAVTFSFSGRAAPSRN
jgi:hypothetical protein